MTCSNCTRCPDLVASRQQPVPGVGPDDADVMLIGEAPGPREDELGEPFVGNTGDRLMGLLDDVEIARDDVFITNAVKCYPEDTRNPTETEKSNCYGYLVDEIERVDPSILVPMGKQARSVVFDDDPWSAIDMVDEPWFEVRIGETDFDVLPTVHPTATFFNAKWHVWMRQALGELPNAEPYNDTE